MGALAVSADGSAVDLHVAHLEMVDAVLAGRGLQGLADVAARLLARPVAVQVPKLGEAFAPAGALRSREARELSRYVCARVGARPAAAPGTVALERAVMTGAEMFGCVALLADGAGQPPPAGEMLGLAAVAALTELAIADAREEAQEARRSSLIELIRANADVPEEELLRRAYRLGSDLSAGAVALCGRLSVERPRDAVDLIRGHQPRALIETLESRIYALVPPPATARDPERGALEAARAVTGALEPYAIVGFSPYCPTARRLHRAIEEAELVLEVLLQEGARPEAIDSSTYRLLVRTLAAEPEEVRRFYENTVAPLVRYDAQYHTDLAATSTPISPTTAT